MRRAAFLALLLCASTALAAEKTVWQIGTPDHSYREFAFAGDYRAYAKQFGAKPVVFVIGRNTAGKDWPFIQPGPVDNWAKSRGKPWTVRFNLPEAPRGVFTLRIEFADVQQKFPPRYVVAVGDRHGAFQLAPGAGDASLTNPRLGKPQKLELALPAEYFRKGTNEIKLQCESGSWVQYDAITLLNDPEGKLPPAEIKSVAAQATPFFIRGDRASRRAVHVDIAMTGQAADAVLRVEAAGQTQEIPVKQSLALGGVSQEVGVPDSPEPLDVKITATVSGKSKTATVRVGPQRKWKIFVAASSHTDVGYTDLQANCAERHCQNIDTAIDLIKKYPDFKWNLEVAWQAENYVRSRPKERLDDFYRYAKEGKIGIQALFCNELTGLCSAEELCRMTWFAHKLCREHGLPYKSAMISDVPSQEASLPMILSNAGIRYFSSAINTDRAYPMTQMQEKCPCWWEGPDGSRVLMMYTRQYAQAGKWGLTASLDAARERVLANLAAYERRADYPYDAVFLHGAVSDNQPLNVNLAEVVKQWNERYEYPKIILAHNAEFYEYMEKNFGDKLPVYRGSAGTYWEDGAGSSARETAMNRHAHEALANGEKFLALADRVEAASSRLKKRQDAASTNAINQAWRNCILYDEHTWGAHCSISEPDSEFTKAQWKVKAQFAVEAYGRALGLLIQGLDETAALVRTDKEALVVFNPNSWPRSGTLDVAKAKRRRALAGKAGSTPPVSDEPCIVVVKDVPACGYRIIPLDTELAEIEKPSDTTLIESRYYRIRFDAESGGITSVLDKELNRELIDQKAPFRFGEYLHVLGGNGSRIVMNPNGPIPQLKVSTPKTRSLVRYRQRGFGDTMSVMSDDTVQPYTVTDCTVWDDVKRIDIVNSIHGKPQTYDKEAVYFAFPFAMKNPTFRYEAPAAIVNANKDMLAGACLDWFTVQHFVEIEDKDVTIAWATRDAPLVCFQDINRGKWLHSLPMTNGHLYAYVMNNYWHTNYCAGQGGDYTFGFSITSRAKSDPVASARFGWAASNPLQAVVVKANPTGVLPSEPTSLMSLDEPNVMVIGTKKADEGEGLIVRLWELTGKATTAHLRLDRHLGATKATACNLVEDPQGPLEIQDGRIAVPIRGSGLATVRIE